MRRAVVLARFDTALYLAVGAHHEVLPVVTSDALALPTSVRLPMRSDALRWGVGPGDTVLVGGSSLRLGAREVRVVRRWRPSRVTPVPGRVPAHRLASLAEQLATAAAAGTRRRPVARRPEPHRPVRRRGPRRAVRLGDLVDARVHEMVGAGAGLTPSGDDALCAVLLVLRGVGAERCAHPGGAAVRRRRAPYDEPVRLPPARGRRGLCRARPSPTSSAPSCATTPSPGGPALAAVLAIGSSSGRDLVAGIAGALHVLAAPPAPSVPPSVAVRQPVGRGNP